MRLNNEPIYNYNDGFMRQFSRQRIKGGRCLAFNQYFKSSISDEVFNVISKNLNNNDNICDFLDEQFEYIKKQTKKEENGYDSQFEKYGDINQEIRPN